MHMAILCRVVRTWQAVAKHLWQMARKQGRKLEVTRSTIKMDLLANACCKTNNYREAGASETPVFTNCLPNYYKLCISMPVVLHYNIQSFFCSIKHFLSLFFVAHISRNAETNCTTLFCKNRSLFVKNKNWNVSKA